MAKPTLYSIKPFDANVGATINFAWTGGRQKANTARIVDAEGHEVYYHTYPSYKGVHVLTPETEGYALENGKQYFITITVTDMEGAMSDPSESTPFRCYTTPNFKITNLKTKDELDDKKYNTVENSSIDLQFSYSVPDTEEEKGNLLNIYGVYLYDESMNVLQSVENLYAANTMTASFSGLEDNITYYIKATGTTVTGMAVETETYILKTAYDLPNRFVNLNLVNNELEGNIRVESHAVSLTGQADDDIEYEYDSNDKPYAAKLGNSFVNFNEQLYITKDFSAYMRLKDVRVIRRIDYAELKPLKETEIEEGVFMEDETLRETLLYNAFFIMTDTITGYRYYFTLWETDGQYQVFMFCNMPDETFSMWSNTFTTKPEGNKFLFLLVQRVSGNFQMKAFVQEVTV